MSKYPAPTVNMSYVSVYVMPVVGSVAVLYAGKFLVAVFINRALTVSGLRLGFFCSIRATGPETAGVAMLVPLSRKYCGEPVVFLDPVKYDGETMFAGYCAAS